MLTLSNYKGSPPSWKVLHFQVVHFPVLHLRRPRRKNYVFGYAVRQSDRCPLTRVSRDTMRLCTR